MIDHKTPSTKPSVTLPNVRFAFTADLKPSPRNARTHSKKQIHQIENSILRFNWTFPVLIDEHSNIVAGHGRYLAALSLGLKQVPVISVSGLSDAERRALALADNKIAVNAGWDRQMLAAELGELAVLLPKCGLDLSITGFETAEIDPLMGDFLDPEQDPINTLQELSDSKPVSRRDDIWFLGKHRLMCGDACDQANLRALAGSDRADMVFTDPPFNLRIAQIQGRGKIKHPEFLQASGEMSPKQFTSFLTNALSLAAEYSRDGSLHYICMDWRHIGQLIAAGGEVYSELKNICVWVKTNAGQGSLYRSQHELVAVFKSGDASHQNNVELGRHGRNRSNVWTYAGVNTFRTGRLDELSIHPTVKPIALVADAMRDCSRRGDIVLDPFMGSGTTILAAEKVGRRAYGLEIDPLYVDVAVKRWQDFTRRDAILKATGETFDEVAATRDAMPRRRTP